MIESEKGQKRKSEIPRLQNFFTFPRFRFFDFPKGEKI